MRIRQTCLVLLVLLGPLVGGAVADQQTTVYGERPDNDGPGAFLVHLLMLGGVPAAVLTGVAAGLSRGSLPGSGKYAAAAGLSLMLAIGAFLLFDSLLDQPMLAFVGVLGAILFGILLIYADDSGRIDVEPMPIGVAMATVVLLSGAIALSLNRATTIPSMDAVVGFGAVIPYLAFICFGVLAYYSDTRVRGEMAALGSLLLLSAIAAVGVLSSEPVEAPHWTTLVVSGVSVLFGAVGWQSAAGADTRYLLTAIAAVPFAVAIPFVPLGSWGVLVAMIYWLVLVLGALITGLPLFIIGNEWRKRVEEEQAAVEPDA